MKTFKFQGFGSDFCQRSVRLRKLKLVEVVCLLRIMRIECQISVHYTFNYSIVPHTKIQIFYFISFFFNSEVKKTQNHNQFFALNFPQMNILAPERTSHDLRLLSYREYQYPGTQQEIKPCFFFTYQTFLTNKPKH